MIEAPFPSSVLPLSNQKYVSSYILSFPQHLETLELLKRIW